MLGPNSFCCGRAASVVAVLSPLGPAAEQHVDMAADEQPVEYTVTLACAGGLP